MTTVSIIGATTWGNTIGKLLAGKGIAITIWARTEAKAKDFTKEIFQYPANINFTSDGDRALKAADFVIWAMPAQSLRLTIQQIAKHTTPGMIHISLAKGLEADSGKRMSEIIAEELPHTPQQNICVLSGPNLSQEINRGLPATSVLAAYQSDIAQKAKSLFHSPNFAIFTSNDVVGVELCGALKNVIALGAGMIDGLGLGDNAKATFITFGWAEVSSLGTALGAQPATFYGLAGLGDLIATCAGPQSRNHYVGREVASGRSLTEVKTAMSNIAEGIDTTTAAYRLATKLRLDTPIINLIYRVLFESLPPTEIANRFRVGLKPEANI